MTKLVRSGLITANAEFSEGRAIFRAPLVFDEEVVCAEGQWEVQVAPGDEAAVADALADIYSAEFDAWCARKAQVRVDRPAPRRPRGLFPAQAAHTPCPVLWAGR